MNESSITQPVFVLLRDLLKCINLAILALLLSPDTLLSLDLEKESTYIFINFSVWKFMTLLFLEILPVHTTLREKKNPRCFCDVKCSEIEIYVQGLGFPTSYRQCVFLGAAFTGTISIFPATRSFQSNFSLMWGYRNAL